MDNAKTQQLRNWFEQGITQKSPFWKVRRGGSIVQTNLTEEDAEKSFDLLIDLIHSITSNAAGTVTLKIELIKNENDSKPISFELYLPKNYGNNAAETVGNVGGNNFGLGFIGQLLDEKEKRYETNLENALKLQQLQMQNQALQNAQSNHFQDAKDFILELLNTPVINTAIQGLFGSRAQIATLTGERPQQFQSPIQQTEDMPQQDIQTILARLSKHTSDGDPLRVLSELINYLDKEPAQAKMALSMVKINL